MIPTRYIGYARPALLLALARHDQVISKSEYDAYQHSVPDGTTVRWYDAGHTFGASSVGDMLDWLAGELRLGPLQAYAHRLVAG